MENIRRLEFGDWVVAVRTPVGPGPYPIYLLLHGWTGDENSMWVFSHGLPKQAYCLAPRGLYASANGGFGWHAGQDQAYPLVADFDPSIDRLLNLVSASRFQGASKVGLNLLGFSQGAALALTFLLRHPGLINKVASLAGFLPADMVDILDSQRLLGKQIYLAHGTHDERVSVTHARTTVHLLEKSGADVTYCEDDAGHKLSAACFRGLEEFFSTH